MGGPPLLTGPLQRTVISPFLSRAVTWRGADDTEVGAIADEFTTNSCVFVLASVYVPWTPQLPSPLHDTSETADTPPLLSEDVPGISIGSHQEPFESLTKNAWVSVFASV